jgi:hypothetical protein
MTIGGAIFLIALGAILRYAVEDVWSAVDIPTVGLILMIAGGIGLVVGLVQQFRSGSGRQGPPGPPPQQPRP